MRKLVLLVVVIIVGAAVTAQVGVAGPPPVIGNDGLPHPSNGAPTTSVITPGEGDQPTSTCSAGYAYAGYYRSAIPGTGQSASAGVKWNAGTVQSAPSHLAGWVGVDDQAGHWIQAGVYKDNNSGLIKYIEYQTTSNYSFIQKGSASGGTVYTASVTKVGAGVWTASIGGSSLGSNVSLSGMNTTQYQGESYLDSSGTCNYMDYTFSSSSPYGTSVMTKLTNSPYTADSVTSNGWRSHGS